MFTIFKAWWYIGKLRNKNYPIRKAAAEVLGELGCRWTVPPLIKALGDVDKNVRERAAEALGKIGDLRAVEPLIKGLGPYDMNPVAAAGALGMLGDTRAIEPLIQELGHWDHNVRNAAVQALGKLGESKWKDIVRGDKEDWRRLGACGDPRAVEPLIKAWGVHKEEVINALGMLGDKRAFGKLIEALNSQPRTVCFAAVNALGMLGDVRAVEPLIKVLDSRSEDFRIAAAEALGMLGDKRAFEPLIKAFSDRDMNVRIAAARAIGMLGDPRAVEPLIYALGDGDKDFRVAVAEALDKLGEPIWKGIFKGDKEDWRRLGSCDHPRAVEPLFRALCGRDMDVRIAAAGALGMLGDKLAFERLIKVLGDEYPLVRRAAAEALAKLGQCAYEPLIKALGDCDMNVRISAALALGMLGDKRAFEPLIQEFWNGNRGGGEALGMLGDPRAVEPLINALGDQNRDVRGDAAWALGHLGDPRAVEPLIKALGDGFEHVRCAAAWGLGNLGDPRAVEPLLKALGDRKQAGRSAATVAEALGKIGDLRAVEPLIKGWGGEYLISAEALGMLGDKRAIEPLIQELGHWDHNARNAAVQALGKLGESKWKDIVRGDKEDWRRLGACGDPRAVGPLTKAVDNQSDIDDAARALSHLDDSRAVESLVMALDRDLWAVRCAAAHALANVAQIRPRLLIGQWKQIKEKVERRHYDDAESNLDHGIGIRFPNPPRGLDF